MKKLTTIILSAVYAISTTLGVAALVPIRVAAADTKNNSSTQQKATTTKEVVYSYVAQRGDSYSKIARKAVQTYAIKNKLKLSNAKVIAAETWLTQSAGSPQLNLAEKISVKESSVKTVVDKATKLSTTQEARWNVYTAGVNFNTNAVGQNK